MSHAQTGFIIELHKKQSTPTDVRLWFTGHTPSGTPGASQALLNARLFDTSHKANQCFLTCRDAGLYWTHTIYPVTITYQLGEPVKL